MNEWLQLLLCFVLAVLLRLYVVNFARIRGSSMLSTLHNSDWVLVWRLPYRFRRPRRGEVVICHFPGRSMRRRRRRWPPAFR